ncbi:MAG TPA: DUF4743 domain-containing protein [Alphaproteobacteria bacterium]|nr:DUF4743 domain-containing protein [Alphaproteobacteria bacterium]
MSFLDRIHDCNRANLRRFRPIIIAGAQVGFVRTDTAARLKYFRDTFDVTREAVILNPDLASFEDRSAAMLPVVAALAHDGAISAPRGELYSVATHFTAEPLMALERAAVPAFGVRAYGVHMNGFVRRGGGIEMWIGHRAKDKPTFPGMLDNMVAGGQPMGITLQDNLIKECAEEAAIPRELAILATPVGAITYRAESPEGLKPDVQFCYDLELPADFVPRNTDGEIERFELWPIEQVMETVANTIRFKFNCNLVIIDFLVRHGLIPPDDPDYLEIVRGLRQ